MNLPHRNKHKPLILPSGSTIIGFRNSSVSCLSPLASYRPLITWRLPKNKIVNRRIANCSKRVNKGPHKYYLPLMLQVNLLVVDTLHPRQKVTRLLLVWRPRLQVNQNLMRAQREQSKLLNFLWFCNNTGTLNYLYQFLING